MSAGDPFSILNRDPNRGQVVFKEPKPKVVRYRKGQAPEWAQDEDEDDQSIYPPSELKSINTEKINKHIEKKNEGVYDNEIPSFVQKEPQRIIPKTIILQQDEQKSQQQQKRNLELKKKEQTEIFDEETQKQQRELLKQKLLEKEDQEEEFQFELDESDDIYPLEQKQEQNPLMQKVKQKTQKDSNIIDESKEKEEESSEIEEIEEDIFGINEDEEQPQGITQLLKPIYVPKEERETKETQIIEEYALDEEKKRIERQRKEQSKQLVIESIRKEDKEEEIDYDSDNDYNKVDDNDDFDQEQQYEEWKIREIKRLKRDNDLKQKYEKEQAEIIRRRNLTDEERKLEDIKLGNDETDKVKKSHYRFMQKYYHSGVFYQDSEDPIFKRDYNIATGEDLRDKSNLPKILQKRKGNFGKKGQSKYTHLTDQDTTNFDPYFKVDESIRGKMENKMAGYKGSNVMDRNQLKKMKL